MSFTLDVQSVTRPTITDVVRRISVAADGTEGDVDSYGVSLSADGRFVVFETRATNLVAGDGNGQADVVRKGPAHRRDRARRPIWRWHTGKRLEVPDGGRSADGRYVVFVSPRRTL